MIRIACFGTLVDAIEPTYEIMFGCFWGRPTRVGKFRFPSAGLYRYDVSLRDRQEQQKGERGFHVYPTIRVDLPWIFAGLHLIVKWKSCSTTTHVGMLMLGELVPCGGGDPIPLLKPKLLVGRKSLCDLALSFANVSSRHCELEHRDGYWFVRDLGSTNGTRVDGEPCESKCLLPGAELSIANHRFTVSYKSDTVEPDADSETDSLLPRASLMEIAGFSDSEFDEPRSVPAAGSDDRAFGEIVPCGGGEPISLVKPRLEVGRHGNCDIRLRYPNVSARHCELEFRDGYWFVHDFGSRNGIQVDGTRCQSKCLKPGSILSIASHRYKVVYTPRSDAPPPEEKEALFARTLLEKAGLIRKK